MIGKVVIRSYNKLEIGALQMLHLRYNGNLKQGLSMTFLNLFHLILAILGLGFLIFIHELGHYFVARRAGMRVEIFSIGFGPALYQWDVGGVKWKFCLLPFGGYVKIAGMEKKDGLEPHQIPDGFYGKKPIHRIKVALAGPFANIIFAFVAFTLIWISGGQEKPFQELTHIVGYVDADSSLENQQIRPGDLISSFNAAPFDGYSDLLMKIALNDRESHFQGEHINYWTRQKTPFTALLPAAPNPMARVSQFGILPAQYLIFEHFSSPASPLKESGIEKGDRLIWADSSLLFSQQQLSSILNHSTALLTVQRGVAIFQIQTPRIKIADLHLSQTFKDELDDWKHAASLDKKLQDLYFLPYQLSSDGVIEDELFFEDSSSLTEKLHLSDQIIAVNGVSIENSSDLLKQLQERNALLIVQKQTASSPISWKNSDAAFENSFDTPSLEQIIQTIGTGAPVTQAGSFKLLPPISLKSLSELDLSPKERSRITAQYEAQKKNIEKIENPQERDTQLSLLEASQKRLMLGAFLRDSTVSYNPTPTVQFGSVFHQTWKTLTNLFTGGLTPKSMSGPVGIVQALQHSWSTSAKEALFWLGFVSLNLAVLNLLPIPVLDGGHILFAVVEIVAGKPIRSKTMEKWIIPFLILLVILFIYLTYQDIARLLHRLF